MTAKKKPTQLVHLTLSETRFVIQSLRSLAHDTAAHSQAPFLLDEENTFESQLADILHSRLEAVCKLT